MSVVDVQKMWSPGESTRTVRGRVTTITARLGFTVLFDSPAPENEWHARHAYPPNYSGPVTIPKVGSAYPLDSAVPCIDVRATAIGPVLYQVMALYEIDFPTFLLGDPIYPDPLTTPPRYGLTFAKSTEQIDFDAAGNALVNVNGEPFDPPLTMEVYDPVVTIERVKPSFDAYQAMEYINTVNSNPLGFATPPIEPGRARLIDIVPTPFQAMNAQGVDTTYWRTVDHIALRFRLADDVDPSEAWYGRQAEMGFYGRDPSESDRLKRIREANASGYDFDETQEKKAVPSLLNAVGHVLTIPLPPSAPTPVWRKWQRFRAKDWTPLGY
jgi:hypothetical protein